MRISDWSSDVCSSDLCGHGRHCRYCTPDRREHPINARVGNGVQRGYAAPILHTRHPGPVDQDAGGIPRRIRRAREHELFHSWSVEGIRSEEHTSELQSLMRISYAVFCLKKKNKNTKKKPN